jgi:hypothetical protein
MPDQLSNDMERVLPEWMSQDELNHYIQWLETQLEPDDQQ